MLLAIATIICIVWALTGSFWIAAVVGGFAAISITVAHAVEEANEREKESEKGRALSERRKKVGADNNLEMHVFEGLNAIFKRK
jgi:uncharacterized membrane protein